MRQEKESLRASNTPMTQMDKEGSDKLLDGSLPELDIDFYRARNPDLGHLSNERLVRHWEKFGYHEGRAGSPAHLGAMIETARQNTQAGIEQYKDEEAAGPSRENIPSLDPDFYRSRYKDLQSMSDKALIEHWFRNGFREGRFGSVEDEADRANRAAPVEALPAWPEVEFDADYYRKRYADMAKMDNTAVAEHWRRHGYTEGRYGSAAHAAKVLASLPALQKSFDHQFYAALYPDLLANGVKEKAQLEQHFHDTGRSEKRSPSLAAWMKANELATSLLPSSFHFDDVIERNRQVGIDCSIQDIIEILKGNVKTPLYIYDADFDNAYFYRSLAKSFIEKKDLVRGSLLLRASLWFAESSKAYELMGNIALESKQYQLAHDYYAKALTLSSISQWVHYNQALSLSHMMRHEEALDALEQGVARFPEFSFLNDGLDRVIEVAWQHWYQELLADIDAGDRAALVDNVYTYANRIYRAYLKAMHANEEPSAKAGWDLSRILIVGDYHVPQCVRYRIDQKVEQLESMGKQVTTLDWMKLEEGHVELATHDVVIFYRVPAVPKVLKAMAQVNGTGRLSLYEIDDLIFDPIYPPPLLSYGGYVSLDVYRDLTRGMGLFNAASRFCRWGIASTIPLQERLARQVFGGHCLLHRNGLDSLNTLLDIDSAPMADSGKSTVDIFYGSGTQAHNSDFIEQALPALESILERHAHARLVVVGYLKLPEPFRQRFASQLTQLPAVKDVRSYWSLLARADINIAVLQRDAINDAKSELKWLEAACFGIPSIVSGTQNYKDVIEQGADALIADTTEEWTQALESLIASPERRHRIGHLALKRVRERYAPEALGKQLVEQLVAAVNELQSSTSMKGAPAQDSSSHKRRKIALVNVFFPPQSIGGATRVLADNLRVLNRDYADQFELCAFTTDSVHRTPHRLGVYEYQGVRVYRATALHRENMDWHPRDPEMYRLFQEFLVAEKPDLIHFHCVQRLTGSVVEAARDAGIPYLVTAHDAWWISDFQFLVDHNDKVYPEGHPDPYAHYDLPDSISFDASIARKRYLKGLLTDAKQVLTVSESFADIYRKNGIKDIEVTPNGISDELPWAPKDTSYTSRIVGGHVGGMSAHKGYYLLKEAVMQVQPGNMEFLVVDHSKEADYVSHEHWGKVPVTFIGRVSQERVVDDLYRKIDVLFAPSTWPESFGLVTREAAACGCWVVASNLGGIGEDVQKGNGVVIDPSVEGVKKFIERADAEKLKRKALGSKHYSCEAFGGIVGKYRSSL